MSLQLAAQHLSDHGRGPDDTLVHMSRKEVKSLNDLAMAHGGQLTINPQTGLPEAGFLSSILPMVAGAALGPAGFGIASSALGAGLMVGAGAYALNPRGGLMGALSAGLGGYGGAGLASGLSNIATSEAGATVQNAATEGANQALARQTAQQQAQQQLAMNSGYANIDPGVVTPSALPSADQLATIKSNIVNESLLANPPPTGLNAVYKGAESLLTDPTADKFKTLGGGSYSGLARMGLSAATPAVSEGLKTDGLNAPTTQQKAQVVPHYGFTPGMVTPTPQASATGKENTYFQPQYRALSDAEAKQMYPGYAPAVLPAADGGLMGYAGGGPVEQMSNDNAIGANTGFPQAYLHNNAYATPYQTPVSQNVLTGAGDVSVDPYTGEQKMAAGGISGSGNLDLSIPLDFGGAGGGGGFGGAGANGYSAVGSGGGSQTGFTGQNNTAIGAKGGAGLSPLFNTGQTPFDNTFEGDTFQPQGTRAFGGNPQQMIGLLSSLMQGQQSGNASAQQPMQMAEGGISGAGYNLGGYSDGGRLLRGPGDGVSDSIPAMIGKKQPARLADGEFVVPARIVSELGNGSTEAGARKLYAMLDRVQSARSKSIGKGKVAKNSRADKYLPA